MHVKISAIEYSLPSKIETEKNLKKDNPKWNIKKIINATGIKKRYISLDKDTVVSLGIQTVKKVLRKVPKNSIKGIIFVTQTPDYTLPSCSAIIQHKLNLPSNCLAFDINLGCSGFVYALSVAGSLIKSQICKNILIVCGDTYSKSIDKNDSGCRPIFSDGVAAIFLEKSNNDSLGPFVLGTDGSGYKDLMIKNSGFLQEKKIKKKLYMNGKKIFLFSMSKIPSNINDLLKKSKKKIKNIDMFIFHQASKILLQNLMKKIKIPINKFYTNIHKIGNTTSASIPIALKQAYNEQKIKKGNLILIAGFGVGLSWGSCIIKWDKLK